MTLDPSIEASITEALERAEIDRTKLYESMASSQLAAKKLVIAAAECRRLHRLIQELPKQRKPITDPKIGLSVAEAIQRAGVSRAHFYRHFDVLIRKSGSRSLVYKDELDERLRNLPPLKPK